MYSAANTIELPWRANLRSVSCIPEGRYPQVIFQLAGYMAVAGAVLSAVSQITVEDNAKYQEDIYE